uniref:Fumarylacetoacetase n=1 Tax=Strombidium inclinatum TaxID=197538 RepID=A0A7S3IU99_9SPIT|mmetsp:Transcript_35949/g.55243  ORF Transcript_35949/g.55243 Transcript_35949/m.55243 type:complete len:226 (+) Transcript_35949:618-1295(+)
MGTFISQGNNLGQPIKVNDARDHIFGYCLLNDWSARDIQKWEYVPLGPFLSKNFASTISPWVVTPEALEPFTVELPKQDPGLLPYLRDKTLNSYDVQLEIQIRTASMKAAGQDWFTLSCSNMKHLYYSVAQTIAHHTVTGCNLGTGDLFGTGTISSTDKSGYGSLLELCWGGKEPISLPSGEQRTFLEDGDEVKLTGYCQGPGFKIGLGECKGEIKPALDDSEMI